MTAQSPPALPPDASLVVAASRARTQDLVMAGLLHDLNGPLNNLGLTLSLLERALASAADPATTALATRLRRYVDTLVHESARLGAWSRHAADAVHPAEPADAEASLASLVEAARASLRHHATLSEVRLEVAQQKGDDVRVRNGPVVRDALLAFLAAAIALADAGRTIEVTVVASGTTHALVRIVLPGVRMRDADMRALDDIALVSASSVTLDLVAARALVGSIGGAAVVRHDESATTIEITLPIA